MLTLQIYNYYLKFQTRQLFEQNICCNFALQE